MGGKDATEIVKLPCWPVNVNKYDTAFNLEKFGAQFLHPQDIRKAIYTTNAIESLNSVIRKALKKRKLFPTDDSAKKVVYLAPVPL